MSGPAYLHIMTYVQIVVNMLVHCCGLHLLICVHKEGRGGSDEIIAMKLSGKKFLVNIVLVIVFSFILSVVNSIYLVLGNVIWTLILVFTMRIVFIAVNRLLEIILNTKYVTYCTVDVAKYFILITWVVCVAYGVVVIASFNDRYLYLKDNGYFIFTFDVVFIGFVLAAYNYIFHKYKRACAASADVRETSRSRPTRRGERRTQRHPPPSNRRHRRREVVNEIDLIPAISVFRTNNPIPRRNNSTNSVERNQHPHPSWQVSETRMHRQSILRRVMCALTASLVALVFLLFSAFPQITFFVIKVHMDIDYETDILATMVFNIVTQFSILSDHFIYIYIHLSVRQGLIDCMRATACTSTCCRKASRANDADSCQQSPNRALSLVDMTRTSCIHQPLDNFQNNCEGNDREELPTATEGNYVEEVFQVDISVTCRGSEESTHGSVVEQCNTASNDHTINSLLSTVAVQPNNDYDDNDDDDDDDNDDDDEREDNSSEDNCSDDDSNDER